MTNNTWSAMTTGRRIARCLACWLVVAGVWPAALMPSAAEAGQTSNPGLTFEGDTALLTVAINADKTADFEKIMQRTREALAKSDEPERRRQAEGWKVMRVQQPLADGTIAYVHIIYPVVAGANYAIMQILYDAFPDERQTLYDLYRGAFAKNLSLATGSVTVDLAKPHP